ncbi:substrate-binding periplasmic protein [Thalassospira sp. SM2505]
MRIPAHFPDSVSRPSTSGFTGNCSVTGANRFWRWASIVTLLCLVIVLWSYGNAQAQNALISPPGKHHTVTLACNPFPPAKIANSTTKPGYDVEILRAAFASRNITLLTPFYPWKRAYFLAQSGQVDGLCSCSYLPERETDFLFSDILGHVRVALYATRDEILRSVDDLEDAKSMTVGVVNGYNLETAARTADIDVVMANSETTLVNLLLSKRLDAVLSFRAPMDYLLNVEKNDIPGISTIKTKTLSNDPYYSCITRKTEHADMLLKELNTGLAAIRQSGLYDSILGKYGILSELSQ